MSDSKGSILHLDTSDTEVELSAEDLRALSDTGHPEKCEAASASISTPSQPTVSVPPVAASTSRLPSQRQMVWARVALSLIGVFVLVSAGYGIMMSRSTAQQALARTSERGVPPLQLAASEAVSQTAAITQPVLFANPFDAKEVFEFSPGTTQDAAREAVAEILLKRAMGRQGG